jgi:DNA-binding transcriptional MerR regulator
MFRIGEFSRLSRVSVRMLRYYDQRGLLKPSQTDRLTSYRYYTADQLVRLNRILALQDLGFSLEQIASLLDDNLPSEELRGMLKLKRAEIEQGIAAEQERLARLGARLQQLENPGHKLAYDVIVRAIGPQLVATRREVVGDNERIQYMFHEVESHVAQHEGARADKPPFTIYHDAEYREHDIDAEVAVPLRFAIPGSETVRVWELSGLPCAACVVHNGAYSALYQAYNALLSWMEASGYQSEGPIREVYLRYGAGGLGFDLPPTYVAAGSGEYVTELQLPIGKA